MKMWLRPLALSLYALHGQLEGRRKERRRRREWYFSIIPVWKQVRNKYERRRVASLRSSGRKIDTRGGKKERDCVCSYVYTSGEKRSEPKKRKRKNPVNTRSCHRCCFDALVGSNGRVTFFGHLSASTVFTHDVVMLIITHLLSLWMCIGIGEVLLLLLLFFFSLRSLLKR